MFPRWTSETRDKHPKIISNCSPKICNKVFCATSIFKTTVIDSYVACRLLASKTLSQQVHHAALSCSNHQRTRKMYTDFCTWLSHGGSGPNIYNILSVKHVITVFDVQLAEPVINQWRNHSLWGYSPRGTVSKDPLLSGVLQGHGYWK